MTFKNPQWHGSACTIIDSKSWKFRTSASEGGSVRSGLSLEVGSVCDNPSRSTTTRANTGLVAKSFVGGPLRVRSIALT